MDTKETEIKQKPVPFGRAIYLQKNGRPLAIMEIRMVFIDGEWALYSNSELKYLTIPIEDMFKIEVLFGVCRNYISRLHKSYRDTKNIYDLCLKFIYEYEEYRSRIFPIHKRQLIRMRMFDYITNHFLNMNNADIDTANFPFAISSSEVFRLLLQDEEIWTQGVFDE